MQVAAISPARYFHLTANGTKAKFKSQTKEQEEQEKFFFFFSLPSNNSLFGDGKFRTVRDLRCDSVCNESKGGERDSAKSLTPKDNLRAVLHSGDPIWPSWP